MEEVIKQCHATQERLIKDLQFQKLRPYLDKIDTTSRGMILVGPRGTGKSTYLLQQVQKDSKALYLSLDNLLLQELSLLKLAEHAYNQGYRSLYLDEVHFKNNWSLEIKNIYDSFPKMKLILSDSSRLVLRDGLADLSRRFPTSEMPLLSFREYIFLRVGVLLPIFNPIEKYSEKRIFELPKKIKEFAETHNLSKLFTEFLENGQRPIFLEGRYQDRIVNIIEKTIFSDIPYFLPSLQRNHLGTLRSIVSHLAYAAIPTVNMQNLCNQWEIGKDKAYELLHMLQSAGFINILYNTKTPKGSSKGDKILFQDASFYFALNGQVGNAREAYFTSALKMAGCMVLTSKDEESCDYIVEGISFEIGGKNKKRKKAQILIKDPLDDFYSKEWPLWSVGFLW